MWSVEAMLLYNLRVLHRNIRCYYHGQNPVHCTACHVGSTRRLLRHLKSSAAATGSTTRARCPSSGMTTIRGMQNPSAARPPVRRKFSNVDGNKTKLSRTERRQLERKEKNRIKRGETWSTQRHQEQTSNSSEVQRWLMSWIIPRIPGREDRMNRRAHWIALAYRIPLWLVLCYVLTDDDLSPYVIQASLGPSMLPTIQFVGDIWLVETGSWIKAWRRRPWKRTDGFDPDMEIRPFSLQVGDLVLWKDPKTKRVSCKRIIGLEGDRVKTYGEYVYLYEDRPDLGIIWPSDAKERGLPSKESFLQEICQVREYSPRSSALHSTIVVPPYHVWLEGDCPLFSVDSRHYGPIPVTRLTGKLVLRLWPWRRPEMIYDAHHAYISSCRISNRRPTPFATEEPYLGKRFGFYKVQKAPKYSMER